MHPLFQSHPRSTSLRQAPGDRDARLCASPARGDACIRIHVQAISFDPVCDLAVLRRVHRTVEFRRETNTPATRGPDRRIDTFGREYRYSLISIEMISVREHAGCGCPGHSCPTARRRRRCAADEEADRRNDESVAYRGAPVCVVPGSGADVVESSGVSLQSKLPGQGRSRSVARRRPSR